VAGAVSIKRLAASVNGNQVSIAWPSPSTGFTLQSADSLSGPMNWTDIGQAPAVINDSNIVSLETTNAAKFFRLVLK
jgi:hypothetical protein